MKKHQRLFDKVKKEDETEEVNSVENVNSSNNSESKKQVESVILAGMRFVGDIKGSHDFFLNGEFEGNVELDALLFVGQSGRLKGKVKAKNILIEGDVEGSMAAKEKLEVHEGGKCTGDILTPAIMVSDKAYFQGRVTMKKDDNVKSNWEKQSISKTESHKLNPNKIKVVDDVSRINNKEKISNFKFTVNNDK